MAAGSSVVRRCRSVQALAQTHSQRVILREYLHLFQRQYQVFTTYVVETTENIQYLNNVFQWKSLFSGFLFCPCSPTLRYTEVFSECIINKSSVASKSKHWVNTSNETKMEYFTSCGLYIFSLMDD